MKFEDQIDALNYYKQIYRLYQIGHDYFFFGSIIRISNVYVSKTKTFEILLLFRGPFDLLADMFQLAKSSAKYYETKNRIGTRMVDY